MVIDVHCHMGASWYGFNHNKLTARDIARLYEKFGIDKGCLSSWEVAYDFEHGNQEVLKICKEMPDVFIPFVIVAPRDGQEAVDMLSRYVEDYGFRGVKIHPSCNRFRVDSEWLMDPICEKCKEYNVPILFHAENQVSLTHSSESSRLSKIWFATEKQYIPYFSLQQAMAC